MSSLAGIAGLTEFLSSQLGFEPSFAVPSCAAAAGV